MKNEFSLVLAGFSVAAICPVLAQVVQKPHSGHAVYELQPTYKITGSVGYAGLYALPPKNRLSLFQALRLAGVKFTAAGDKADTKFKEVQVSRPSSPHKLFAFKGDNLMSQSLKAFQVQEGDKIAVF